MVIMHTFNIMNKTYYPYNFCHLCIRYYLKEFLHDVYEHSNQEGRIISRQHFNEYLETLHLAPTQVCDLPGFYRKTCFLRSHLFKKIY